MTPKSLGIARKQPTRPRREETSPPSLVTLTSTFPLSPTGRDRPHLKLGTPGRETHTLSCKHTPPCNPSTPPSSDDKVPRALWSHPQSTATGSAGGLLPPGPTRPSCSTCLLLRWPLGAPGMGMKRAGALGQQRWGKIAGTLGTQGLKLHQKPHPSSPLPCHCRLLSPTLPGNTEILASATYSRIKIPHGLHKYVQFL